MAAADVSGGGMSVHELRQGLRAHLKESGAMASLKTQLRSTVMRDLLATGALKVPKVAWGEEGSGAAAVPLSLQIADALVDGHLRATGRNFTQNIFSSETDACASSIDAASLLELPAAAPRGPLVALVEQSAKVAKERLSQRALTISSGTQTEGPSEQSLEHKLAVVDANFALRFTKLQQDSKSETECRLRRYEEEIELRMKRELQEQLNNVRIKEISEMRSQERAKFQSLLDMKREEFAEMERSAAARVQLERDRIAQSKHDLELQRAEVDKRHHDVMKLLEEKDKAQQHTEKELSTFKEKVRMLQTQLLQYEDLCGSRLQEVEAARSREQRRIDDLHRAQAEHMQEMRLREEEISQLKYRLRLANEEYEKHTTRFRMDASLAEQRREMHQVEVVSRLQQAISSVETQQHATTYQQPTALSSHGAAKQQPPVVAIPYAAPTLPPLAAAAADSADVGSENEGSTASNVPRPATSFLPKQQAPLLRQSQLQYEDEVMVREPSAFADKPSPLRQQQQQSSASKEASPVVSHSRSQGQGSPSIPAASTSTASPSSRNGAAQQQAEAAVYQSPSKQQSELSAINGTTLLAEQPSSIIQSSPSPAKKKENEEAAPPKKLCAMCSQLAVSGEQLCSAHVAKKKEQIGKVEEQQTQEREGIAAEESDKFKALLWAEKSQRDALRAKEEEWKQQQQGGGGRFGAALNLAPRPVSPDDSDLYDSRSDNGIFRKGSDSPSSEEW